MSIVEEKAAMLMLQITMIWFLLLNSFFIKAATITSNWILLLISDSCFWNYWCCPQAFSF